MTPALARFHPQIRSWFQDRFRAPTDVQERSWPRIAAGEHLLITAPTGSGKTLTAFLWAIDAFATGQSEPEATRVLYVSPLKALNNDVRANLVEPIAELRERFARAGLEFPSLRVQTRSGDTEPGDRQRMLRRPPELLITTPESLTLLLTTLRGRQALSTIRTVILDEIHSVVENRRGVQLMTGLERLVEVAGEFQRLALSATVRPLEAVADYVGGRDASGERRPVGIVDSKAAKAIDFRVRFPEAARVAADNGEKIWEPLSDSFRDLIDANRSTLFFTNSRRMAEKITLKLNDDVVTPVAYAHHGSLSREIRTEVETRLKQGDLRAIVATNSLEMGIDIGDLDEVVLIQSPPSIASSMQRVGRAGHRVGDISRGSLFPTFAQDFLEAAVLAKAVHEKDIEPLRPLANPLDVLAQTLVSCAATEEWETDKLYDVLTRAAPYATLPREQFDLVIEMLAGRYAGTRVRDLKPRLAFDRVRETVKARQGAAFALYTSGGTIPDRGYYTLRHAENGAVIGELDEEFVWESTVGQTFTLGTQNWLIQRITHNDVLVKPGKPKATAPPFWRAEGFNRSAYFSERIAEFLLTANEMLKRRDAATLDGNLRELGFDAIAADELVGFLKRQRETTGADLPHAQHLLVEHVKSGPGGYTGPDREQQVVLHTIWGGRVNRPIALAMEAAWQQRFPYRADVFADNDAIVVQVKDEIDPAVLLDLVTPANFEPLLRQSLEGSGFFGARFRECAGRSLLLTKRRFNQRMPLWMTRQQAKRLMTATRDLSDFPVMLETWRTCLKDEFDLVAAYDALERLAAGELNASIATVSVPSPFAAGIAFNQVSRYMYADDTPDEGGRSSL
ncbi:MAG: DEAD/DEAH box helicase, partial [Gammaproteobacteria bacterium]|nr:DEAD/DEAH box helicase [Gammaproteobacteria bacterium]